MKDKWFHNHPSRKRMLDMLRECRDHNRITVTCDDDHELVFQLKDRGYIAGDMKLVHPAKKLEKENE